MKSYKWLNPFLFILPSNKISSNQNEPDTRSCCILLTASYSSKQFYIASSEWSFSIFPSSPSEWLWHCSVCSFSLRGLGCPQFELITRSFQTPLFYKQEHNLITDFLICLLAERSGLRTWNNITWSFFLICIFFSSNRLSCSRVQLHRSNTAVFLQIHYRELSPENRGHKQPHVVSQSPEKGNLKIWKLCQRAVRILCRRRGREVHRLVLKAVSITQLVSISCFRRSPCFRFTRRAGFILDHTQDLRPSFFASD